MRNIIKKYNSKIYIFTSLLLVISGLVVFNGDFLASNTVSAAQPVYTQNGNAFGAIAELGTIDNFGVAMKTNNLERIRVNERGDVGMGTSNPFANLHIRDISGNTAGLIVESADSNSAEILLFDHGLEGALWQWDGSDAVEFGSQTKAQRLILYGGDLNATLTLQKNGDVGINTDMPKARLHVVGGDTAITTQGNGLILRATAGPNCYKVTVDNAGVLTTALVSCP